MLRLHNVKLPLSYGSEAPFQATAKVLGVPRNRIAQCSISRKSVDARKKSDICFVVSLDACLKNAKDEPRIASRLSPSVCTPAEPAVPYVIPRLKAAPAVRPIVVGMGPAVCLPRSHSPRQAPAPSCLNAGRMWTPAHATCRHTGNQAKRPFPPPPMCSLAKAARAHFPTESSTPAPRPAHGAHSAHVCPFWRAGGYSHRCQAAHRHGQPRQSGQGHAPAHPQPRRGCAFWRAHDAADFKRAGRPDRHPL